ncbi:HEPN domain-containing protein [Enterobacter roggenkampii]|uniref:HEPN domain-containing protein n=1 Tax=Enterobacter roggenkampii TaxID=1812935 RepID=UPI002DBD03B1|nr:HEPN domain-containing protein [Enterobacter roggenkampii]MEB6115239.1 hypothetical protein [Enterobacter roggenkampii]
MQHGELDFSANIELDVDVYINDNFTSKGVLTIKCNASPFLSIDLAEIPALKRTMDFKISESIIRCNHKNDVFLLHSCNIHFNCIYPKFIIKNNHKHSYSKIYMSIPGLFIFFNGLNGFHEKDGLLSKHIENEFLNTIFTYNKEDYRLIISHDFSVSSNENETIIAEDATLCIEKTNGSLSLEEAQKLSMRIVNFFSLILGEGLSIKYISLGGEGYIYSPFYFLHRYTGINNITYQAKALISHPLNMTNEQWHLILNNYFSDSNSTEFENIWARLVSMHSYNGYWEYKILGFASILDVYSQQVVNNSAKAKIPPFKMKEIKSDLISLLNEKATLLELNNPTYKQIIESFSNHITNFKNTDTPNFKERYRHALKTIDNEFLEIINFTEQDFITIKNIRDAAAHGKPVQFISNKGNDNSPSKINILLNKLAILLTCLAFKKLGILEKNFAKMISLSHNHIKINALLDEVKLDIYTGEGKIINIEKDTFSKMKTLFAFDFPVLENKTTNDITFFDPELTNIMKCFKVTKKETFTTESFCNHIYENYHLDGIFCIEIIKKLYCRCKDKTVVVYNSPWISFKNQKIH